MLTTRRGWLTMCAALVASAVIPVTRERVDAASVPLDVAYAGSMTSLMEGPVKSGAAQKLDIEVHGHAQGSNALAQLIVGGSLTPDVFVSVTPSPMEIVLKAGKADSAVPVARTAMVIAYSPKSSIGDQLAASGKPDATPWWQVLQKPDIRFGRTDPNTDPQGRNIIFVMQLAEQYYHQPGLAAKILGPDVNPSQIFEEATVQARLQSGELDAASAYRLQPAAFGLPYVALPDAIDLSNDRLQSGYAHAALTLGGKTYHPEPLVYYAAVLKGAAHPKEAAAFVKWLQGADGQRIFKDGFYDPIGGAKPLAA
jgi:molybdate/tungstate transport system substrate-binding protein